MGYDVEAGAVGEAIARIDRGGTLYREALDLDTPSKGVAIIRELHSRLDLPATLYICGKTLLHALEEVRPLRFQPLFDIEQHTYSHILFRDIHYTPATGEHLHYRAATLEAIEAEINQTSQLFERYLGFRPLGLRTPFGYYQGLKGRPDLLEVLDRAGIRFVSSFGRNEQGGQPTPWVQPYTYREEGYPHILEIPFQFWLDVLWYDTYGWDRWEEFKAVLKKTVDYVAERNLVWGTCFHEWVLVKNREPKTRVVENFLRYAKEREVPILSYRDFHTTWEEV